MFSDNEAEDAFFSEWLFHSEQEDLREQQALKSSPQPTPAAGRRRSDPEFEGRTDWDD